MPGMLSIVRPRSVVRTVDHQFASAAEGLDEAELGPLRSEVPWGDGRIS